MKTKVMEIDEKNPQIERVTEAAEYLAAGKLVAFPTETVYGIGANALSEEAAANIYKAKGRPSDNPLIVHLADWEQLPEYVTDISVQARQLAAAFWPGPLTMIFKKRENISGEITGGLDTVGIRIPIHPVARAILRACNLPVAAPSANISGKPSPTEFAHVLEDLDGRVDMIIKSGSAQVGLESTVIDMSGARPVILRPGGISKAMIEAVIGPVDMNRGQLADQEIPMAPGMKYRHYAPKGKIHLLPLADFDTTLRELKKQLTTAQQRGKKTALLVPDEYAREFPADICFDLGPEQALEEIARHLFDGLRFMDLNEIEDIFATSYPETGIGEAIMNRLKKAAGSVSKI
ncbi:threonylcarbamoyl-AMP synthase [Clostridiales bacterium COT073_COT-073]|nr:threonylcarbamoyl-AMP synthase [Clostridiales bacterium COT073_COT-073]